jgi:hypothetical protein
VRLRQQGAGEGQWQLSRATGAQGLGHREKGRSQGAEGLSSRDEVAHRAGTRP